MWRIVLETHFRRAWGLRSSRRDPCQFGEVQEALSRGIDCSVKSDGRATNSLESAATDEYLLCGCYVFFPRWQLSWESGLSNSERESPCALPDGSLAVSR